MKNQENDFPYEDIVNLEHYKDPNRKPMPILNRAAQFMPFKSLNEYESYVERKKEDVNRAEDLRYTILYE